MRYLLLAQVAPSATTDTELISGNKQDYQRAKFLVICNRGGTNTTFRVRHAKANAAASNEQYWFYDTPILANDSLTLAVDAGIESYDSVFVYAGNANLSFNIYGEV
jgi:hypothetical protein